MPSCGLCRSSQESEGLTARELGRALPTIIKSGALGTMIGAIPGLGATLGAFIAYSEARRSQPRDEVPVGKGSLRGIAAAEAGNSATNGSNMIPLVTLGIPGNVEAALFLGAFMIHGITPGPMLMTQQPVMLYAIFISLILANFLMLGQGFVLIRLVRYVLSRRQSAAAAGDPAGGRARHLRDDPAGVRYRADVRLRAARAT